MSGILDYFLKPENVQRGVNLLQSNKGIVSGLAQNLTFLPSSLRSYAQSLAGSTTPITEDFFNTDQLSEIKRRTAEQMANKSMIYEPENISSGNDINYIDEDLVSKNVVPYGEEPLSWKGVWKDPKVDISSTFGMYTYKKNPDGTISAIDKHDFDSLQGGGEGLYGQGAEADLGKGWAVDTTKLGTPRYKGERELPFLPPVDLYGRTQEQATAEEVIKDPFTGEVIKPDYNEDRDYYTQSESLYQSKEEVLADAFAAFKKGHITSAKFARLIGGIHAIRGDVEDKEYAHIRDAQPSHIPVNVNLGKISHLDKLRANKNFARYLATHKDIPSQIKKQAATHAGPISTAPINVGNPFGYGGGNQSSGSQKGSKPTGTAGRNPWGRADGGLATMFQRR